MSDDQRIVELDVRPQLEKNEEPFKDIMAAIKSLQSGDIFVLHATFEPIPLFRVMERKGFKHEAIHEEQKHWIIRFWKEHDSNGGNNEAR